MAPRSLSAAPGDYDELIKRSASVWMPTVDWRLWRAQIETESAFKASATSPVGAQGLAQVMPGTFRDIARASGIVGDPYDPEVNLMAGAWYMARQRAIFKAPRPETDRHNLACGAYNAGAGNIIRAQRLAGDPSGWEPVASVLPQVTGRHATETVNYVKRIRATYRRYILTGI